MATTRAHYRAKPPAIRIAAIRAGIDPPTGRAIAKSCGLPTATINAILRGRPPRSETMAVMVRCLGGTVADYFDIVDG